MAPRDKPPGGGPDVFWFTAHANTKHGAPLDPQDEGIGSTDKHHPYLGRNIIMALPKNPTAKDIKKFMFGASRYHKVDLYLNSHKSTPVRDGDNVDLDKYGLTKNDHLLFVDRNHDKKESKEAQDEQVDESVTKQLNKDAKYKTFTKRLKNITRGDWSIYPEAIKNTHENEILWTDGNSNHTFASAPTIQAYKVVRRQPNNRNGSVMEYGLASTSPYYFQLLD